MIQASFRIVAPEGKREELLRVLAGLKEPTEVSPGCRGCRIVADLQDGRDVTYLTNWASEEEAAGYLRSERFRRLLPYIEMSVLPPEITFSTIERIRGVEFLQAALNPRAEAAALSLHEEG